ncbi:hypothetical protein IKQ21_05435 [bacterium]|nr:hypothetical protein [bacterium]
MPQDNIVLYNPYNELDEDININYLKIWKIICSRKKILLKVFCLVLIFFILLTFIVPKKYKVTADLYINKSNSSNMLEVNPYALDEASSPMLSMGTDKAINNEIELMKSELVLDKVIRENGLVYKKKFGFIPNKKEGEFLTAEAFYKKGKVLKIENTKNTNVVTIEYKHKKPEISYGVVSSLISNYIELHKELNTEKSKSDMKLLESEYTKIRENLEKNINKSVGLPVQSMTGIGNLSAMSAFSRSASEAIGNIKGQYLAGEKSQIAVSEERQKLTQLATKLEWAKMVEQMSDSSKVLVLKEPKQLRPFENTSPKLIINVILGVILGALSSIFALIYVEITDKKLAYSKISNNVIYNGLENVDSIKAEILGYDPDKILLISLVQLPQDFINNVQTLSNAKVVYANLTKDFLQEISSSKKIMIISKIQVTSTDLYKKIESIIEKQNKVNVQDILI